MYLEAVEEDTGCLRVVPGSQHRSFNRNLRTLEERDSEPSQTPFGILGQNTPGYAMETQPTDLLVLDARAYHGAFGGSPSRANIQLVYFPEPSCDEDIATLRQIYRNTECMLRIPECFLRSDSLRLRGLVAKNQELGFDMLEAV